MSCAASCTCPAELHAERILVEVLRYSSACRLARQLAALASQDLPCDRQSSKGLMTGVIFEGLQAAATAGQGRTWVHPILDVHRAARVCEMSGAAKSVAYTLEGIALSPGCVLGVLREEGSGEERKVPMENLQLLEEAPFYRDELLPALECIQPHQASRSALRWFTEKLCSSSTKLQTSFAQKRRKAWSLVERVTILFYEERKLLAELKGRLRQEKSVANVFHSITLTPREDDGIVLLELHVRDDSEDAWFSATCSHETTKQGDKRDVLITLEIGAEHVTQLRRLASCRGEEHFRMALALLLLRYAGLSGGDYQLESGWHAGIPSSVFDALVSTFHVSMECFASPLNCTLPQYFSAFPDTDSFFGCCGNFLGTGALPVPAEDATKEKGLLSLEANPPFDHDVIAAGLARALQHLEDTEPTRPLSFVFILPDSTQAKGIAVRTKAEQSRFFRGDCVISPELSMYVHGARHIPRRSAQKRQRGASPRDEEELVTLSCPTRLLVLQNDVAAAMLPAGEGLEKVRSVWEALPASVTS
ncbi:putative phosphorylated CTD-interacting factor 1-like [Trypanosoma grayi]|uniref:putative phosphorylated CTD-interacting factor 1-like n=1 Tax=Trypanosoma grayi TaxID=71804 RepID=UPI0004F47D33|nr:putative phosphorylated CTD-interacting factor 1-like [Trypanosoma grayi]KEG11740.1 putative phosphorylated CTD-interacting factor 1-like [Trypanosoma grayi]